MKIKLSRYALIIPVITLLFTASCAKKEAPKPAAEAPKEVKGAQQAAVQDDADPVSHKVLSFNLEGLDQKGAKKWDVKGETAEAISEDEIRLDNIVAKSYGDEAEAVITADEGVYDRSKNNVRLEKNVKATIEATQGFTGDFVGVPDDGSGASARPKAAPKGKKTKTVITCDGEVQFDYEQNQAHFLKNVHVVSEDGIIDADKITVYLDGDTRQLKEIVAEGNVKITRGENITYSDTATYNEKNKKITLTGRPRLVIYQEGDGLGGDMFGGGM